MTSTPAKSLDRLVLGAAGLTAAVALLVFALRGGTADASGVGAGQIGRYQLSSGGEYVYRIIDTTNGDIFVPQEKGWAPLDQQLSASLAARANH